jgi:hypothetical protein
MIKLLDILKEEYNRDSSGKTQEVCDNLKKDIMLCIPKLKEYKLNGQLDNASNLDDILFLINHSSEDIDKLNCDELDYLLEKCYYWLYSYGTYSYKETVDTLEQQLPTKSNDLDEVDYLVQQQVNDIATDMGESHTSSSQRAVMANRRKTDWLLRRKLAMRRKRNKICNSNHAKWSAKEHKCVYFDKVAGELLAIKAKMRRKNM